MFATIVHGQMHAQNEKVFISVSLVKNNLVVSRIDHGVYFI